MNISLKELQHDFIRKPLLVGGKAMEYYKLRQSGEDIDLISDEKDVVELIKLYPDKVKDLLGDLGVCPMNFEIWRTICFLTYDDLKNDAMDIGDVLVISEEKLLFMKVLAMKKEKYLKDTQLIVDDILNKQNKKYKVETSHNKELLQDLKVSYLEKIEAESKSNK